jgi:3-deoxy-D-manno-octulosonate 8-phosphate phosphatase (KDO 8-P phosphatase)
VEIKLIILDVDGCMTDGSIIYSSEDEIKSFNVKDGLAIASWIKLGKKVAIITGRSSQMVKQRADELGVQYLYQDVKEKDVLLREIAKKENLDLKQIAVIGDDLNDFKMLSIAGISFAPADCSIYIHEVVDMILSNSGGKGAIREMIEYIVKKDNLEREFLALWK